MPPAPLDSAPLDSGPTHERRGILWLVVAHVAVGVLASVWASPDGGTTDVARGALSGLWLGQASVLGVWLGLGTTRHWMRLAGGVLGVVVICRFSKIASGDLEINSLGFLLVATAFGNRSQGGEHFLEKLIWT